MKYICIKWAWSDLYIDLHADHKNDLYIDHNIDLYTDHNTDLDL